VACRAKRWRRPEHAERTRNAVSTALDDAAENNIGFVIVFAGYDTGEASTIQYQRIVDGYLDDSSGESLVAKAERLKVKLIIEMLNTKGDDETWRGHSGYLGNSTDELVNHVVKPINSTHFRLAFDIYHVVMMGEDPLKMLEAHGEYIAYIHVAGVMTNEDGSPHPQNRGELHLDGQAIDYPVVMAAAKHVPKGTFCLIEYIPEPENPDQVEKDLRTARDLCEQNINN